MKLKIPILLLICLAAATAVAQKQFTLQSPDGRISATIQTGGKLTYSVLHDAQPLILDSPISLTLTGGEVWGKNPHVSTHKIRSIKQTIPSPFYRKAEVPDEYNELTLTFRGQWGVEFRAYNDGIAYRFVSRKKTPFTIQNEETNFCFTDDATAIVAPPNNNFSTEASALAREGNTNHSIEEQFTSSFENTYLTGKLSELDSNRLFMLPLVVNVPGGKRICITESDLESYPGLYLNTAKGTNTLTGVLPPYPKETVQGGHNQLQMRVKQREDYIARVDGPRTFPWRAIIIAGSDKELADTDMTYKLAAPSRVEDISWIRPGKVAWEWWNDWNLEGVDFETGVNNDTYKYYIDFAANNGIEYVILDEGWSVNLAADLMQVVPEIDLPELVKYAAVRNVGIILWAGYHAFNRDMENICRHYAEMGVKGFKVDFMDRDDQEMVDFNYRAAETAARYKLILDLHGMYKPAGLNRTYPNVLNFEGVFGLEQMKWQSPKVDMVTYDVTIPFIRQVAGPLDYTQGAMKNAAKGTSYPSNSEPMSQGTRCRQLAAYIIFDSPFNMLCDAPTNYKREPESLGFIAQVPTVWDETITLDGRIGEYIITARRKGDTWYIGGFTNWDARDLTIDLSFLGNTDYQVTLFKDGVNAHRKGTDYKKETFALNGRKVITIHAAPGGGFVMRLEAVSQPEVVSHGRIIHRFFDTSPVSPSGKYIALFRLPYEDRSPSSGDTGEVVVIDLATRQEVCVTTTRGWEMQLGANVQWGATDADLFYNDVDAATWQAYAVHFNFTTGKKQRLPGTVFMASPDGRQLASYDLRKSRFAQVGYGVVVPTSEVSRNIGPAADDGVYITDLGTNQCRLVASIRDIYERSVPSIRISNPDDYEYYCFQVKWNPQGTRLLTTVQWTPRGGGDRRRAVITMKPDGTDIRTAITPEQWEQGGHHINWMTDGEHLSMNLNVDGRPGLEIISVRYDGTDLREIYPTGSGHPSQNPRNPAYFVTDAYAGEMPLDGDMSPIRLINLTTQSETNVAEVYLPPIKNFEFRLDAHPAWDRTGRYVVYNGMKGGTRRVYIVEVK